MNASARFDSGAPHAPYTDGFGLQRQKIGAATGFQRTDIRFEAEKARGCARRRDAVRARRMSYRMPMITPDGTHYFLNGFKRIRDDQGMAIHPRTGTVWVSEHGPRGGDGAQRALTDMTVTGGVTRVRAVHIQELRGAVK